MLQKPNLVEDDDQEFHRIDGIDYSDLGQQDYEVENLSSEKIVPILREIEQQHPDVFANFVDKEFGMDDVIKMLGGSCGYFQILSTTAFVIIFAVGSQFFYSMPFYQQYPALKCYDKDGSLLTDLGQSHHGREYCPKEFACDSSQVNHFEIDWDHSYSLNNWMTELDLICQEPYKIGLLGSISFMSFSLGSVLITKQADDSGRKNTVLYSGLVTPIGIIMLLYMSINLKIIYAVIFMVGLTYNARSSGAYLYSSEFLETSKRINIGTCIFTFSGIVQALSAFWFWYVKDQSLYLCLITFLMLSALLYLKLYIPESPLFLFEKERYAELRKSLNVIGSTNKIDNLDVKVNYSLLRLKLISLKKQEEKRELQKIERNNTSEEMEISIFQDPITRANLISVCILWSTAGFITYLLLYYSKYFSGNFYLNYAFQGCSDIISMGYISFISNRSGSAKLTLQILLWSVLFFTFLEIVVTDMSFLAFYPNLQASLVPILLLLIRMNVGSIQNYGYHINQLLFPVMMRGQSYGITNFVSRPFASIATIVVEYTLHPLLFIVPLVFIALMCIDQINEVDYENGRSHDEIAKKGEDIEEFVIEQYDEDFKPMKQISSPTKVQILKGTLNSLESNDLDESDNSRVHNRFMNDQSQIDDDFNQMK